MRYVLLCGAVVLFALASATTGDAQAKKKDPAADLPPRADEMPKYMKMLVSGSSKDRAVAAEKVGLRGMAVQRRVALRRRQRLGNGLTGRALAHQLQQFAGTEPRLKRHEHVRRTLTHRRFRICQVRDNLTHDILVPNTGSNCKSVPAYQIGRLR